MSNLSTTDILEFAVFGLAVAQALTILLTIRREKDIDELRELVDQQRLRIVELTAWLAGRNSLQQRRITAQREEVANEHESVANKVPEPEMGPRDLPDALSPPPPRDDAARAEEVLSWQREITALLQPDFKGSRSPLEFGKAPERLVDDQSTGNRPDAVEIFHSLKKDPAEPQEASSAHKMVADPGAAAPETEPTIAPKDLLATSPSTEEELERATRAIDRLKEDVEKARVATSLAASAEKKRDAR